MVRDRYEAATVAATVSQASPRIEIVSDRRRAHSAEFRAMVAEQAREPGARVTDVAIRHGLCPSLVYRWRRSVQIGEPTTLPGPSFVPITLTPTPAAGPKPLLTRCEGTILIELPGDVRLTVPEGISTAALRRVLAVLRG